MMERVMFSKILLETVIRREDKREWSGYFVTGP
jgi:hypothetical protein